MKTIPLFLLSLALPAFAGTSGKEVVPAPAPNPCLFTWFAGGSVGYLTELEEPMYNLHVGTDTCWKVAGWDVALFAEIGYAQKDEDWSSGYNNQLQGAPGPIDLNGDLGDLENALEDLADFSPYGTGYDLDIMPITLNAKLERQLSGNLNAYFGAGIGLALVDLSVDLGYDDLSDDDWVFTGQIFAGLNYNFNENCEVYGGARWIYFDDAELSDGGYSGNLELDDDFLFELGARYNF